MAKNSSRDSYGGATGRRESFGFQRRTAGTREAGLRCVDSDRLISIDEYICEKYASAINDLLLDDSSRDSYGGATSRRESFGFQRRAAGTFAKRKSPVR